VAALYERAARAEQVLALDVEDLDLLNRRARVVDRCFRPLGMNPSQLRADRILDEARHTADPVHLMRVFGISDTTAMKYLYTAHPARQSVPSQ
jgi:hypothetical protein